MVTAKRKQCVVLNCSSPSGPFGRCAGHQQEYDLRLREEERIRSAIQDIRLDGQPFSGPGLQAEMLELNRLWMRSAIAQRYDTEAPEFGSETKFVTSYAEAIARIVVAEELAHRSGKQADAGMIAEKAFHWERFTNLKAGLNSNGTPRR